MQAGGATLSTTGQIDDEDPLPELSAGAGGLTEGAGGGSIRFAVRLQPASERMVTVLYATADVTATAGSDYTAVSGTLTFHAGTTVRTVTVPIADDALDEAEEQFAVSLQAATNATVTAAEGTGTITDNDESPALSIDDASLAGGAANATMPFAVRLQPASERMVTVLYATADVTATAGPDYTAASGTLTFHAGTTTATVAVTILADTDPEETETFTVTLTAPSGATLADVSATGTISGDADTTTPINVTPADSANRLGLSSLAVTGAGAMFPAFDAGTLHYALTCSESATLSLSAATGRDGATVTLLRADSADNVVSDTGSLDASVTVDSGNDMAIEVSDRGESVTYVVPLPALRFPRGQGAHQDRWRLRRCPAGKLARVRYPLLPRGARQQRRPAVSPASHVYPHRRLSRHRKLFAVIVTGATRRRATSDPVCRCTCTIPEWSSSKAPAWWRRWIRPIRTTS